jgi:hypothetical protein
MSYYSVQSVQAGTPRPQLHYQKRTPTGAKPLVRVAAELLPPQISELHEQFHHWGELGISPGPVLSHRIWLGEQGELFFYFPEQTEPEPLLAIGIVRDLAAWLVLLDKWMETFVVVSRARSIWTPDELAGALRFTTPAFLPPQLISMPPGDNWTRVAHALALAVADEPLQGSPENRHWQKSE